MGPLRCYESKCDLGGDYSDSAGQRSALGWSTKKTQKITYCKVCKTTLYTSKR